MCQHCYCKNCILLYIVFLEISPSIILCEKYDNLNDNRFSIMFNNKCQLTHFKVNFTGIFIINDIFYFINNLKKWKHKYPCIYRTQKNSLLSNK